MFRYINVPKWIWESKNLNRITCITIIIISRIFFYISESIRNRPPRRQNSHDMTSDRSSASSRSSSTPAPVLSSGVDSPDVVSSNAPVPPIPSSRKSSVAASSTPTTTVSDQSTLQSQSTPQRRLIKADLDALYGNAKVNIRMNLYLFLVYFQIFIGEYSVYKRH